MIVLRNRVLSTTLLALPTVFSSGAVRATESDKKSAPQTVWIRSFAAPYTPSLQGTTGSGNGLLWDTRFLPLLRSSFPQRQWFWYDHNRLVSTADLIRTFLGVTGDAILDEHRYVTVDGCVQHVCDINRGMLWIDTAAHPANLIFVAINLVGGNSTNDDSHVWLFSSGKLNWQHLPPSFAASLPRWLNTIGASGYRATNGYRFHFVLATIVQPNGIMEDISPDTLPLGTPETGAKS